MCRRNRGEMVTEEVQHHPEMVTVVTGSTPVFFALQYGSNLLNYTT